jgi:two-component system, cell cycle sensor histidine kinase and response regulator CckA
MAVASDPRVILVVDDEASVRRIARLILERAGYCVLEATDGRRALELLQTYNGPLDLVISDVVMPHMTGTQLVEHLRVKQPGLKTLLISGHVSESPVEGVEFLRKPFTAQDLQSAVSALLPPLRRREAR